MGEKMEVDSNNEFEIIVSEDAQSDGTILSVTHEDQTVVPQATRPCSEKIDKEWTDEERMKMANSALFADAQKEDQQTEKQAQTEENNSERLPVNTMKGMETSKPEEQKTKPEIKITDQKEFCSNQKLLDNGETMEVDSNNEFEIVLSEDAQSDGTILCKLSPEISAVDMEIRWFKETDCVCFYKNKRLIEGVNHEGARLPKEELERGNVSLQLKKLDAGDYLCQVTSKDRTEEITIAVTHEDQTVVPQATRPCSEKNDKEWTDEERMKMANSALFAVFYNLEKRDAQKKDQQTEKQTQTEENDSERLQGMETSKLEEQKIKSENKLLDNENQYQERESSHESIKNEGESQPGVIKKPRWGNCSFITKRVNVFSILAGKTNNCDKKFIAILGNRIENLKEVGSVDKSNIILIFCPIVSRTGTDIDAALNKFNHSTDSKLVVLVVLHHTFDPEKTVPDSSRCVKRTDILTVDLLFYEDTGLLECQKNSDAINKTVNWLIVQGEGKGIPISPLQNQRGNSRFFSGFSW